MNQFDDQTEDDDTAEWLQMQCRVCGSTDVRWRQQGGRWALFSMRPGVLHECDQQQLVKDFE